MKKHIEVVAPEVAQQAFNTNIKGPIDPTHEMVRNIATNPGFYWCNRCGTCMDDTLREECSDG